MIRDFEQQDFSAGGNVSKPCARPKHGRKADVQDPTIKLKLAEPRAFEPRPGH
jgi:hypothetical protein